jgi:hypothetical protein
MQVVLAIVAFYSLKMNQPGTWGETLAPPQRYGRQDGSGDCKTNNAQRITIKIPGML